MKQTHSIPYIKELKALALRKKVSVYIVGGYLRDELLSRVGVDIDFTMAKGAIAFARTFANSIKGAFVLLDEEHPCGRVVKRYSDKIYTYDFSDYRASDLKKDVALRDFTINTLLRSISDDKDVDYQHAQKDLKAKTIRMVSNRAFKDDPLRLMRAFSLQAQLGFKIETKTFKQIVKDSALISRVSVERIREELFKVLSSARAFDTFKQMDKAGLFLRVIPQLYVMKGVHQGGYHHLNVYDHSLEVMRQFELILKELSSPSATQFGGLIGDPGTKVLIKTLGNENVAYIYHHLHEDIGAAHKRYALLKLACLLHDIGKPQTKKKEKDGRTSFHGHEQVGAQITRHIARDLKLSTKERYYLEDMVAWHLRPGYMSNFKKPSERMVFRFLRDTQEEALSVLLLAIADQRATCGPLTTKAKADHHLKICLMVIDEYIKEKNKKPLVRLLTGHDLIKKLKLKPSPLFAKILNEVQEAQALGKIATKQEALALAKIVTKKW